MVGQPRYPEIRVHVDSTNPLALVAAVREAMRRAHIEKSEIMRFSEEALGEHDDRRSREICGRWVWIDVGNAMGSNGAGTY